MNRLKIGAIFSAFLFSMLLAGTSAKASEDTVECNWGIPECHRVKDANGITYVYHGIKVVVNQE